MNILIVGLGSMGRRRAGILARLRGTNPAFAAMSISCVDQSPARLAAAEYGGGAYPTLEAALAAGKYDAAFVCAPPLTHAAIIGALLAAGVNVFTEINLVDDGYDELVQAAAKKGLTLFLSSTMLYRGETAYIGRSVREFTAAARRPVRYIYHVGQYLPDWHPWEKYTDFFVGNPRTGGVREILAIELPWMVTAFGGIRRARAEAADISGLDLPYLDSICINLEHENGIRGYFAVDVATPKAVRNLEVYSGGLHLYWEGNPKSLYRYDDAAKDKVPVDTYESFEHDTRYSDNIVENAYVDEILNFFDVLAGKAAPKWSFAQDRAVLQFIDAVSAGNGGEVRP